MDNTIINMRGVILSDSAFGLDAVCGILKDCVRSEVPIIDQPSLPFNSLGGSTSGYNYTALSNDSTDSLYIKEVFVSKDPARGYHKAVNPGVFPAFVDFRLENFRYPRS